MAAPADAEQPLEALSDRLRALEAAVGTAPPPGTAALEASPETLLRELGTLLERFQAKGNPEFEAFVERYLELEQYLGTDKALKDILATHQMKERMVLLVADHFRPIAVQLESLEALKKGLDREPVPGLPKVQERLAAVEATALVRIDEGAQVSSDVEAFLQRYNEIIEMLNEKFLFYHRKLAEWEALVDAQLEKRGIRA